MPGLFSCCKGKHKELKITKPVDRNNGKSLLMFDNVDHSSIDNTRVIYVPEEYEDENDGHLKSYHSDDLSVDSIIHEEEEDAMRGVSNVVYRKE